MTFLSLLLNLEKNYLFQRAEPQLLKADLDLILSIATEDDLRGLIELQSLGTSKM